MIKGNPECPLCLKKMKSFQSKHEGTGKVENFFVCLDHECMVSINMLDQAVGKWEIENPPICPKCNTKMRVFFRSFDKYFKSQCPKCRKRGKIVQVVRETIPHDGKKWSVDVGDGE